MKIISGWLTACAVVGIFSALFSCGDHPKAVYQANPAARDAMLFACKLNTRAALVPECAAARAAVRF